MSGNKNNNGKKKIAPIIFTILIVLYLVGIIAVTLVGSRIDNLPVAMILIMVAPCILAIVGIIVALKQRISEINGGEEDEARKY